MESRTTNALVMTVAPPGAGKSTWAAEHFTPGQRVSLDHLRWVVSGDEADQSATPTARTIMHTILAERMRRGLLTVLDATNSKREYREAAAVHACRWSLPAVAVVLHTPLHVCLLRQHGREKPGTRWPNGRRVPAPIVETMHREIAKDLRLDSVRSPRIRIVAHIGHPAGDFRTGYVPAGLRPALPWLAALPERWPQR